MRVKTPRVVAAAALNSLAVFPENVSLRLRPTCLPLTILAAAISLTQIPEGLRRSFRSALVFPPSCENFRAVIGAGLSNDLAPPSQNYRYYIYVSIIINFVQTINKHFEGNYQFAAPSFGTEAAARQARDSCAC